MTVFHKSTLTVVLPSVKLCKCFSYLSLVAVFAAAVGLKSAELKFLVSEKPGETRETVGAENQRSPEETNCSGIRSTVASVGWWRTEKQEIFSPMLLIRRLALSKIPVKPSQSRGKPIPQTKTEPTVQQHTSIRVNELCWSQCLFTNYRVCKSAHIIIKYR